MRGFAFVLAISVAISAPAAAAPQRVASLNLCTDELLLTLAAPDQIASVSYLSQQEHETRLWRRARRYPKNDGSLISVVRHRPDLVVGMGGGGRDSERIGKRLGMTMLILPLPRTLQDVETSITRLASVLDRREAGKAVIARITALKRSAPPATLEAIWLGGGGRTVAATSLDAQWMKLTGLRQRPIAGDRLTLEQLVSQPPTILLQSHYRSGQYSSDQRWLSHPLVTRTAPIKTGTARTVPTDGRPWTCGGPPMIGEILRLRKVLAR